MFDFELKDIVSAPVITVGPDTSVSEAIREMMRGPYSGLPVIDGDKKVIGVVTEFDVLKAAEEGGGISGVNVADIMTKNPVTVDINASASDVIGMLIRKKIIRLPVTSDGKLVGIVARRDIIKRLSDDGSDDRDISFVFGATTALLSAKSSAEMLRVLVEKIGSYFGASRCSVIRVERDKKVATVLSTYEDRNITNLEIDLVKYPEIEEACRSGKPIILKNAFNDPLMASVVENLKGIDVKSILVFPIVSNDKVVGTLHIRTHTKKQFSKKEINVATMLANIAADAIKTMINEEKLKKLYRDAARKVIIDDLTGLFNRRFLDIRIAEEFNMALRHALPLSCIMLDIDDFKNVNDTFGHNEGDKVLVKLALSLKKTVRISDIAARYGGEEFLLVLPATDEGGAQKEAERIKYVLDSLDFGPVGRVTMSIGIAGIPYPGVKKPEDLIKNADIAMYAAKKAGKNCTVVHSRINEVTRRELLNGWSNS